MIDFEIITPRGPIRGKQAGQNDQDPNQQVALGIHGWSQRNGWHTWEPMMMPLANAGIHTISIDMPGWGSSPAWQEGPLGYHDAVSAIFAVLDGVGTDTACLMGKSWGGGVALKAAIEHPSRLDRLILTAPAYRDIPRLAGLTQPVLLAWAEDDPVIPYSMAAQYVDHVPEIQLETYATGGHNAAPNNVEDFAPKAIAFLQR